MGLSIHYSGTIKDYSLVDELTFEVEDICKSLNWKYTIFTKANFVNDTAHITNPAFINYALQDLKGIYFSPEECEPVMLTFFSLWRIVFFFKTEVQ